jgi:hypothetical protein
MNKPFSGFCETYFPYKQVQTSTAYFEGELHGPYRSYYSSGNLKSKVVLENGFVKGFIRGSSMHATRNEHNDFDYPMTGETRDLFFRWSIKDEELNNF